MKPQWRFLFGFLLVGVSHAAEVPLWQLQPFDRVTLSNGDTHDVEPIHLEEGVGENLEPDTYVGKPGLPPKTAIRGLLRYMIKRVDNGESYYVLGRHIRKIDYFEDLLIGEARTLLRAGRYDEAFAHLEAAAQRDSHWPGLTAARVEFLREEGLRRKFAGDFRRSFFSFAEAKRLRDDSDETMELDSTPEEELADCVNRWVADSLKKARYGDARRAVAWLEEIDPTNPTASAKRAEIVALARTKGEDARREVEAGRKDDAVVAVLKALDIDPSSSELSEFAKQLFKTNARLRVAVESTPSFAGGPGNWSSADQRAAELIHVPLVLQRNAFDSNEIVSSVLSSVTRPESDLNRRAVLEVRENLVWPADGKPVTAGDVQRLLAECCRPESEYFQAPLARLLTNVQLESPRRLVLDFDRPQQRPESWLTMPMMRLSLTRSNEIGSMGLGIYALAESTREQQGYAVNPGSTAPPTIPITSVVEIREPHPASRLELLEENRVDIVTDLPPTYVARAAKMTGVRVVPLALPRVHVLQFNMSERLFQNRTVRRAIDYAIDRSALVEKLGLHESKDVRFPTAPWPANTLGLKDEVQRRPYDPVLARTLLKAAMKRFPTVPRLRLIHGGSESERMACEEIGRQLARVGLDIDLVPFDPKVPMDIRMAHLKYVGRTIVDPVYDVIRFLASDNPTLDEAASPWLRQVMNQLVDAPNLATARDLFPQLHQAIHDDVAVISLWECHEHLVVTQRLQGLAESPRSIYEGIADWTLQPGGVPPVWNSIDEGKP